MHFISYRHLRRQLLFLFLSITPFGAARSQTQATDSVFLLSAVKNAHELYVRTLGVGSHLLNGVLYKEHNASFQDVGHPYFESDDWVDGSVFYDGELYEGVGILYDLVNEKVVIDHPYAGIKLELISEKINYFSMPGHRFVRLDADTMKSSPVRTGFYDVLYDGRLKFYVKRHKDKKEQITQAELQVEFLQNDRLYIYKQGQYIPVRTKSSVLEALSDRKSDLRKYIRKNKIHFRRHWEEAITRVVSFYDESGK
jgi:hypothetical protein